MRYRAAVTEYQHRYQGRSLTFKQAAALMTNPASMLERIVAVEALEAHTTPRPGAPPRPPTLRPVT